jgi:large subunit ribosomal protein L29
MALKDAETKPVDNAKVRELSVEEVADELARLEEARFRLTFRSATEAIENSSQFRIVRRNIARLKTILREKRTKA